MKKNKPLLIRGKTLDEMSESDFEPVGTEPVVGDVLCAWPKRNLELDIYRFEGEEEETVVSVKNGVVRTKNDRIPRISSLNDGGSVLRILRRKSADTRSDLRVYLAGPMTGIPDFNFPAFNAAEVELLKHYKTVFNPARNFDGKTDLPRKDYMRKDFEALLQSDVIAVLPGWAGSAGAKAEVLMANQLGLKAILMPGCRQYETVPEFMRAWAISSPEEVDEIDAKRTAPETILQEAQRLVGGDRGSDYGHPLDDYNKTGMIWGALLYKWAKLAAQSDAPLPVPADLACLMMVGVKLSRHVNKRKRDNLVDAAGYLRCTEMCEDEQERRNNTENSNG